MFLINYKKTNKMSLSMKELWGSSHISAGHAAYLEGLYETFLNNPEELSKEWLDFLLIFQSCQIQMERFLTKDY